MEAGLVEGQRNVLFVDDESLVVDSLKMVFRRDKTICTYTTTCQSEALEMIEKEPFHVVVSDMRMPGMNGAELLSKIKIVSPNTLRILLTGYAEMDSILKSINQGEVYRFLEKPWVNRDLKNKVLKAADISASLWEANKIHLSAGLNNDDIQIVVDKPDEFGKNQEILFIGHTESGVFKLLGSQLELPVHPASNVQKAMLMLSTHPEISVILVHIDAKYRERNNYSHFRDSTALLKTLKALFPSVICLVVSNERDAKTAIELVNEAQVFRYLSPPVSDEKIVQDTRDALQYARMIQVDPTLAELHHVDEMNSQEKIEFMEKVNISLFDKVKGRFSKLFSFNS